MQKENKIMRTVIQRYLEGITSDECHRYKSWDNCHSAFSVELPTKDHCLHLAFYLASWGMYRGSSGLLQKNHLIHQGAVDILFSKKYLHLKCNAIQEVTKDRIADILNLKIELSNHYRSILFTRGAVQPKPISATDTLISKILLGTFACVPAYDRYFIDGLKDRGLNESKFNESSLNELFDFIETHKNEIIHCHQLIKDITNKHYPVMKILDMFFWQIGFDCSKP